MGASWALAHPRSQLPAGPDPAPPLRAPRLRASPRGAGPASSSTPTVSAPALAWPTAAGSGCGSGLGRAPPISPGSASSPLSGPAETPAGPGSSGCSVAISGQTPADIKATARWGRLGQGLRSAAWGGGGGAPGGCSEPRVLGPPAQHSFERTWGGRHSKPILPRPTALRVPSPLPPFYRHEAEAKDGTLTPEYLLPVAWTPPTYCLQRSGTRPPRPPGPPGPRCRGRRVSSATVTRTTALLTRGHCPSRCEARRALGMRDRLPGTCASR